MKILINTFGTRGDIQPFIALAQGLQRAGHSPIICTAEGFRPFIEGYGIAYAHMDNSLYELTQGQDGKAVLEGKKSGFSLVKQVGPMIRQAMEDEWAATQAFEPDLILQHPKSLGSYSIAQKLNLPLVMAMPVPMYTPTRAFPLPMFVSTLRLGGWFNRLTYQLGKAANVLYSGIINDFRVKTLRLPRQGRFADAMRWWDGEPVPMLYPYSRHVLPVPPDYPAHVHVTGYWFLTEDNQWQPSTQLLRFLEAGKPPVYVGFGSMSGTRGEERGRIVVDALQKAGQRGVLMSGWGGLQADNLPDSILMQDNIPHDWLFPHMAAVVHHGGSGTVAAGLRAGKATVVCPFIADQPFWGHVLHELEVSPMPIVQKNLTAENLASAITLAVTNANMQQRAMLVGEKIRAEDGITTAIEVLERLYAQNEKKKVMGALV